MSIFYICFDLLMACIMFLFGLLFYKSKGKAANLLAGYNNRPAEERKQYDENEICRVYGKRRMIMAVPFLIGTVIDLRFVGIGCLIAWGIWFVLFILLLVERHKREK